MVKDAAAFEQEDRSKAELIEIRNKADGLVYATESFMVENIKLIPLAISNEVKQSVDSARSLLAANASKDKLVLAIDGLEATNKKMYEICFSKKAAVPQNSGAPSGEIIDATFDIKEPT